MTALFLRPDADQSDGSWLNESASGTNIYQSVDETSLSDTDYIQSSTTDGDKVRLRLSDPSGGVTAPLIVRYRCKRVGTAATNLIGRLYQGTAPGTLITTFTQLSVPDTFTTYTYTLTSAEFTSITDFTDLYVEFELSQQPALKVDLNFAAGVYYNSGTVADATGVLTCTRASPGYATNADGTLTSFAVNTLRIGVGTGVLLEGARTNVVLWNQDLTNAAWTKVNMSTALNQTGPDGVANSATLITASAANATVLQAITLTSSARYQSAYVKRITGSGTINMTMDNGATWTAITVTSSWALATIPSQTLANPTVGFRIVTNGDAIAVDFVQNENSLFATSPIVTTTAAATRAVDAALLIGTLDSLIIGAAASFVCDALALTMGNTGASQCIMRDDNVGVRPMVLSANNTVTGAGFSTANLPTNLWLTGAKAAVGWTGANGSLCGDGGTVIFATTVPTWTSGSMYLSDGLGGEQLYGYIRRITVYNTRLADVTLQALSAP